MYTPFYEELCKANVCRIAVALTQSELSAPLVSSPFCTFYRCNINMSRPEEFSYISYIEK